MPTTTGAMFFLFANDLPLASGAQLSFLGWLVGIMSVGGLIAFILDFAIFAGACFVALRLRRVEIIAAYLLFVPIPALIALFSALRGIVSAFATAAIMEVEVSQSHMIQGIIEPIALFCTCTFLSILSYIVLTIAIFVRVINQSRT